MFFKRHCYKNEEVSHRLRKIFTIHTSDSGLVFETCQVCLQLNCSVKIGEKTWTLHKRRYTKGQQAHEKMLAIIHHYRNANQNHSITRMAEMKETDLWKCGATIFSYIASESVKWYSHFGKQFQFLIKLNICLCDPAVLLLHVYCKRFENKFT